MQTITKTSYVIQKDTSGVTTETWQTMLLHTDLVTSTSCPLIFKLTDFELDDEPNASHLKIEGYKSLDYGKLQINNNA